MRALLCTGGLVLLGWVGQTAGQEAVDQRPGSGDRQEIRTILRQAIGMPADRVERTLFDIGALLGCNPARCRYAEELLSKRLEALADGDPTEPAAAVEISVCNGAVFNARFEQWLAPGEAVQATSAALAELLEEFGPDAVRNGATETSVSWHVLLAANRELFLGLSSGSDSAPRRDGALKVGWFAAELSEDIAMLRCEELRSKPSP